MLHARESLLTIDVGNRQTTSKLIGSTLESFVGESVVSLERHFNSERGFDREDDRLPYDILRFEAALDEYYDIRAWEPDGTVASIDA